MSDEIITFTAERFYEDSGNSTLERDLEAAGKIAASREDKAIEGIEYTTFTFHDRSKFTVGSNGYVGCELPESTGSQQ